MACRSAQMWSLSGLIAGFLDLAIAYLLLCAAAVAYFASKFLGFFGLHLPCPCDGTLFSIGSKSFCLNRLLFDLPVQTVSHVVRSVVEKFPFHDSVLEIRNRGAVADVCVNGIVELEGEASCSSVGDVVRVKELSARAEKYDLKGKGVVSHRPRSRLRQRRKGVGGLGKNSAVQAGNLSLCEAALGVESYFRSSANKGGNGLAGGSSRMGHNEAEVHILEYDDKAPTTCVTERAVNQHERNSSRGEDMFMIQNTIYIEELQNDRIGIQNLGEDEENAIRLLERRLEEERTARAALYSELEKERSSAATAADEALAMILRLQEEKASIEMEARQYQRILEEKSVYDAEEMTILKEILIRREKEKHFLEKEVEAYQQMVSVGNEQLASGRFGPNDDLVLISREITGSTDRNMSLENKFSSIAVSVDKPTSKIAFVNESPSQCQIERSILEKHGYSDDQSLQSVFDSVGNMDLQEKEIISVDNNVQLLSKGPKEGGELELVQELNSGHKLAEKIIVHCPRTEMDGPDYGPSSKLQSKNPYLGFSKSCDQVLEKDSSVHDVHIDEINFCSDLKADRTKRFGVITHCPSSSTPETEFDATRINSEISWGFPPAGSRGLSRSVTTVDHEMLKIGSEVGWLQERLKLVQEGREKVSISGENRERENIQLKLLEDIAWQVQEIRHLTETGKSIRQVSLPLPSSKVVSKKRRSRSVSSSVQMSSEG